MTISAGTVSEFAIASGANLAGGPGAVYSDSIQELSLALDQVSAHAIVRALLAEEALATDVAASPGGNVSDSISETLDLSDGYAASGLWTVVAQTGGTWLTSPASGPAWTLVEPTSGGWIKQ